MTRSPLTSCCARAGSGEGAEGAKEVKGSATGRRDDARRRGACPAPGPARATQVDAQRTAIMATRKGSVEGLG